MIPTGPLRKLIDSLRIWALMLRHAEMYIAEGKVTDSIIDMKVWCMVRIAQISQRMFGQKPPVNDRPVQCKACGDMVNPVAILHGTCLECINNDFDEWIKTR